MRRRGEGSMREHLILLAVLLLPDGGLSEVRCTGLKDHTTVGLLSTDGQQLISHFSVFFEKVTQ